MFKICKNNTLQQKSQTHSLDWFKNNRLELFKYVEDNIMPGGCKYKIIKAPVKSGKREMVEVYALFHKNPNELENEVHNKFLTALHRIADEKQRSELRSYNIDVCSNLKKEEANFKAGIYKLLHENKQVHIHLDELDYGSGEKQLLSNIFYEFKDFDNVKWLLYSATPEVALLNFLKETKINNYKELPAYEPPTNYYGIKHYLNDNLFYPAQPFFELNIEDAVEDECCSSPEPDSEDDDEPCVNISTQGEKLIETLIKDTKDDANEKHIGILRLAGNFSSNSKGINQFSTIKELKEQIENKYKITIIFVGNNDETIKWDSTKDWKLYTPSIPILIIINQVAGRSTAWKCHPYLSWYHTNRTPNTPLSTIIQDQERIVYYKEKDSYRIRVYGDVPAAHFSAGHMTLNKYKEEESRLINQRLKIKKNVNISYEIYDKWDDIPKKIVGRRKILRHVKDEYKLSKTMNYKKELHIIDDDVWDNIKKYEGFYINNLRSSRKDFITSNGNKGKHIYFKSDILKEIHEGLGDKQKQSIRINLVYEDIETNPDNFKFMVRQFNGYNKDDIKNNSMYNK